MDSSPDSDSSFVDTMTIEDTDMDQSIQLAAKEEQDEAAIADVETAIEYYEFMEDELDVEQDE